MRLYPFSSLGILTEEEIDIENCSNHVYVPHHLFVQWLGTSAVMLTIRNAVDQEVVASMYHAQSKDADAVYVPAWMLASLDCDTEMCHVAPIVLPTCSAITLQPHNEEDVTEMELFQASLERYSAVRAGQEVTLWHPYGYSFVVNVCTVEPDDAWVSIAQADIPLVMLPPVIATTAAAATVAVAAVAPPPTAAVTTDATLRQRCFEAARRRMEAKEKAE